MTVPTMILPFLSFIVGGLLVYWRENRKAFQEKMFEYKYVAYKEIIEQIGMFHQNVYDFLESYQSFEGTEQEWHKAFEEESGEYYAAAMELDRLYFRYLAILPEHQLNALRDLTQHCVSHVTVHHHFNTALPHESYDAIWQKLMSLAEAGRKDLSVNVLNITLSKRLTQEFYPISLPVHFNRKGDGGQGHV